MYVAVARVEDPGAAVVEEEELVEEVVEGDEGDCEGEGDGEGEGEVGDDADECLDGLLAVLEHGLGEEEVEVVAAHGAQGGGHVGVVPFAEEECLLVEVERDGEQVEDHHVEHVRDGEERDDQRDEHFLRPVEVHAVAREERLEHDLRALGEGAVLDGHSAEQAAHVLLDLAELGHQEGRGHPEQGVVLPVRALRVPEHLDEHVEQEEEGEGVGHEVQQQPDAHLRGRDQR